MRVDWLVSQFKIVGGAETYLRVSAPRLRRAGIDLRVISLVDGGAMLDELRAESVPVVELGERGVTGLGVVPRLARLWSEDRPDLVHTHLYHAGILGRAVARWMGIQPVLVHQHGPEMDRSPMRTWLDGASARWVTHYIVTCQAVADILEAREGIPAKQIEVLPNGIEIIDQTGAERPAEWPAPPGTPSLAFVGRLALEKGPLTLIHALAQVQARGLSFHTCIFGEGPLRRQAGALVHDLGLERQITFMGLRGDVRDWLPFFDLFALPSDWEGVSLALLEAMAAGLAVVATAVGGTPEVVVDGVSGVLVPKGSSPDMIDALAGAIAYLLADPGERCRMGQAAKRRVADHFSLEENTRRLLELYNHLLEGRGA